VFVVNYSNSAINYRSGDEFIREYTAMRKLKAVSAGLNGYFYRQTTAYLQNGMVGDGNRGRVIANGPQVRTHVGRYLLVAKFQKEMLAQNRADITAGSSSESRWATAVTR